MGYISESLMNACQDLLKITFFTKARQDQITFYFDMLNGLNEFENVRFDINSDNFRKYDVVLLMYSDCEDYLDRIRKEAPSSKIGIVDPRNVKGKVLEGDFIVAQGIEEENYLSDYYRNIFRYDFHPVNPCTLKEHRDKNKIIIGCHGNKVHLHTMYPHLCRAIEALAGDFEVEFRAYYNIRDLGKVDIDLFPRGNVEYREIQWTWDMFQKSLPEVDIGVVPNLIPIRNPDRAKRSIAGFPALFNESPTDYLVRYKVTSNIGRLYPFAQLGIPVVADLYPSACSAIEPGDTGFFGGTAGMWYRSLHALASSAELRRTIGRNMQEHYKRTATPEVFNREFVRFLRRICSGQEDGFPEGLSGADELLNDASFLRNYAKVKRRGSGRGRLSGIPAAALSFLNGRRTMK